MERFLSFTVEEMLAGKASQLKEVTIGARVFDRDPAYDPRLDPIVRVEARRLRAKLNAYYSEAGKQDPVLIDYPKGGYAPRCQLRGAPRPESRPEITVAVLPFANLGKDSDYFSDGLSDDLIHALTRIQGLVVVAWDSAVKLRSHQEDATVLGQHLGAEYLLRGSVRKTETRLRIVAHLIDSKDGRYLWSETFDRSVQDVFAIQKEIAMAIASELNLRFRQEADALLARGDSPSLEAYHLCLQGRFLARERTHEGLKRSLVLFSEAAVLDPTAALAYSGLADTHTLIAEYGFADGCDHLIKAKEAAAYALRLDPLSAEAHASLALGLALYDWDWKNAEAEFTRALELNPSYSPGHFWFGSNFLAVHGRLTEAYEQLEVALRLDPLSLAILLARGLLHVFERDYKRSIAEYELLLKQDPSFYRTYTAMGRSYILMGEYPAAIEMLLKGVSLGGPLPRILGPLGQAQALAGRHEEAEQTYLKLKSLGEHSAVPCNSFAFIHMGKGETAMALTWLERAVARHQPSAVFLQVHPAYDCLRSEPRFQRMLASMGLSDTSLP